MATATAALRGGSGSGRGAGVVLRPSVTHLYLQWPPLHWRRLPGQPPFTAYWRPAITNCIGPACGFAALKYISYPAQVGRLAGGCPSSQHQAASDAALCVCECVGS